MGFEDARKKMVGVVVVTTTAFKDNYEVDKEGIKKHTRFLIDSGVKNGTGVILPTGSTGECPMLREDERKEIMKIVIDEANGEVPVVCGCNHTDTRVVIELAKFAQDAGADGVMISPPYYWKPSEEVVLKHYSEVAKEIDLGIMVYNNLFATQLDLNIETLEKLAQIPNVVALKENSGKLEKWDELYGRLGDKLNILAGNGDLFEPYTHFMGSKGMITGVANFLPKPLLEIYQAELDGDLEKALKIHKEEVSPFAFSYRFEDFSRYIVYLKEFMNVLKLPAGPVRAPLVELSKEEKDKVKKLIDKMNLSISQ